MTQPRGVSLPPFGQCLCIAKLAVAHIIHKYRGANFAKRGHNCLTNKALRRTGQNAQRKFVSECDTCVISIYCRPVKRKAYEWGNTRKCYWRIADSFILHRKSPKQRPQHRGQIVFGSCHIECHIPHGATQIHLDARVQHDAFVRLYQHHVHTQRTLVAGGKML